MATPASQQDLSKLQKDPSKSFGEIDYFKNRDQQRIEVNKMRREEQNKRSLEKGLTKNIKKAVRKGQDPSGFIRAAQELDLNPLGGGGFGQEASQRDAGLRARAADLFEQAKASSDKQNATMGGKTGNAGATPPAASPTTTGVKSSIAPTTTTPNATTTAPPAPTASGLNKETGQYSTTLGNQAYTAFGSQGNEEFRQGLNRAIKVAKTPQEINDLRDVASQSGISAGDFNARVPNELRTDLPSWANEVKNDSTFKGQDLGRFKDKTRAEAFDQVMQERTAGFMDSANQAGADLYAAEQAPILAEQQRAQQRIQQEANAFLDLPAAEQVRRKKSSDTMEALRSIDSTSPENVRKQVDGILKQFDNAYSPENKKAMTDSFDLMQKRRDLENQLSSYNTQKQIDQSIANLSLYSMA